MILEVGGMLKALQARQKELQKELKIIDQAVSSLEALSSPSRNGHPPKRVMSVAGRRRIAKAQRERWAKVRKDKM